MNVTYCSNQMDAAIRFVLTNNPYATNWTYQDVYENILNSIQNIVKDENCTSSGTAGYTVIPEDYDEDRDTLYVAILVSPAIGAELEFETLVLG